MANNIKLLKWQRAGLMLFCIGCLFFIMPYPRTLLQRLLWEIYKPAEYYMLVDIHNSYGSSRKGICIKNNQPFHTEFLNAEEFNSSPLERDSTMPAIFGLAMTCSPADILNCMVEFDPLYHYPVHIEKYEGYAVSVQIFVNKDFQSRCLK